jgi:integrase
LLKPAKEALERQYELTGKLPPIQINVLQRDDKTIKQERFRPVFVNTSTLEPYTDVKQFNRQFFIKHLEAAEVRHRCVSICRHSFASQMLSSGVVAIDWICEQLGHTTDAMLRRKYAKHFKKQRKVNPADVANQAFGFE